MKNLFDYLKAGERLEDFLDDFPSVSKEQAIGVLQIAQNIITLSQPLNETAS